MPSFLKLTLVAVVVQLLAWGLYSAGYQILDGKCDPKFGCSGVVWFAIVYGATYAVLFVLPFVLAFFITRLHRVPATSALAAAVISGTFAAVLSISMKWWPYGVPFNFVAWPLAYFVISVLSMWVVPAVHRRL